MNKLDDANMLERDSYNLDFVLMPLVRMLAERQLSWSDREQIAHAIIATTAHHKSMTDEMQIHAQGVDVLGTCNAELSGSEELSARMNC